MYNYHKCKKNKLIFWIHLLENSIIAIMGATCKSSTQPYFRQVWIAPLAILVRAWTKKRTRNWNFLTFKRKTILVFLSFEPCRSFNKIIKTTNPLIGSSKFSWLDLEYDIRFLIIIVDISSFRKSTSSVLNPYKYIIVTLYISRYLGTIDHIIELLQELI